MNLYYVESRKCKTENNKSMDIEKLRGQLQGSVILPNDSEYDASKAIYNAMIDKRPALFVKCKNKHDVAKAISFAKDNGLEISIKAGGHNGAGLALVDNGLVIDLSEMKSIKISLEERIAIVEPGNTLSDVDNATHEHGLAIPVGVNGNTGISGLTLGGGLGFLTRKAGLTIDHLIAVEEVFKPIRKFGPPILDFVNEMPMPTLNSLFDWLYPPGLQWYWKGHYVNELTDDAIATNIKFGSSLPTPRSTMHLYPIDGKAHEVGQEDTAWGQRNVRWVQAILGVSDDSKKTDLIKDWSKGYYDAMLPYSSGGGYVNFSMQDDEARVKESYGVNFDRLRSIKKKYDPENFFHLNQNIKPAD